MLWTSLWKTEIGEGRRLRDCSDCAGGVRCSSQTTDLRDINRDVKKTFSYFGSAERRNR